MPDGAADLAGGFEQEELTDSEYTDILEDEDGSGDDYAGLFSDDVDIYEPDEINGSDDLYNRRLVQLKKDRRNKRNTEDRSDDEDDIQIYNIVGAILPETKTTCDEMRKKSLVALYKFVHSQISMIEQTLADVDPEDITFSCSIEINVKPLDASTIKKVRRIIKWFYVQRKFSVSSTKDDNVLTLTIDWGDFKFLV